MTTRASRRMLAASLALAATALAAPSAAAAQDFQGVVTMKIATEQGERTVQYKLREGNTRVDLETPRGAIAMISLSKEERTITLMDEQRMYMERPMGMMGRGPGGAEPPKVEVTQTGKKETIAGWECEHWLFKTDASTVDACLAKGLGSFMMAGGGMGRGGPPPAWQAELRKTGLFPLKISSGEMSMEVASIEKQALEPSLFTVPEGYQKMEMPGGMRRP